MKSLKGGRECQVEEGVSRQTIIFKDMDFRMSISSWKGSKKQHGFMYCTPRFDAWTPATSQDLDFLSL